MVISYSRIHLDPLWICLMHFGDFRAFLRLPLRLKRATCSHCRSELCQSKPSPSRPQCLPVSSLGEGQPPLLNMWQDFWSLRSHMPVPHIRHIRRFSSRKVMEPYRTIFRQQSNKQNKSVSVYLHYWLVVWTPLKNISQLGWLFPIYGNIKKIQQLQYTDGWPTEIMRMRRTMAPAMPKYKAR